MPDDLEAQPRPRVQARQLDVGEQLANHRLADLLGGDHGVAPVHGDAVHLELLEVVVDPADHRGERIVPRARRPGDGVDGDCGGGA